MRLRNVAGSREAIEASPYCISDPESMKGIWRDDVFHNDHPLHLEIGMGKGDFLCEMARLYPSVNFIGLEKFSSVLIRALEKRCEGDMDNLFFIRFDATYLSTVFEKNEVDMIYLNFSDPWPKDRHAKRRLTSPGFLKLYDDILSPDGSIIFKTDNRALFDYSVETIEASDVWEIKELTYDLHHSEFVTGNVMTEYEKKFTALGHPICRLRCLRKTSG